MIACDEHILVYFAEIIEIISSLGHWENWVSFKSTKITPKIGNEGYKG